MATVVVAAASGRQGTAQVRQLSKAGYKVRALSRRADPFCGETFANTEVMATDLTDDAAVARAFEGADAVFYTHPLRGVIARDSSDRSDRAVWLDRLGRAAKSAGVGRFVWNTSSWIPDKPGDPGFYAGNTEGINALWRSGVPGTVIGPVLFMDNLLTNWAFQFIVREGRFVYAHRPDTPANWISLDDVAKIMIASLDRPDMEGAWLNVGGPDTLTPVDIARMLSDTVGKKVAYDPVTPRRFGELLTDAFGDEMGKEERDNTRAYIDSFYQYNISAPTRPFEVDLEAQRRRMPIELESFSSWAERQDWTMSNAPRPPGG